MKIFYKILEYLIEKAQPIGLNRKQTNLYTAIRYMRIFHDANLGQAFEVINKLHKV